MKPKIRPVDVMPLGKEFYVKDVQGISKGMLVSEHALLLMGLMDGSRSLLDIKADFLRLTGVFLRDEELMSFIQALDQALLLENERAKKAIEEEKRRILDSGIRRMSHAGEVYPKESQECKGAVPKYHLKLKLSPCT